MPDGTLAAGQILFGRIDRPKRLPDEIANSISTAIETGRLGPGDRLPTEQALSEQFGVARTVVREAVSLLKYDGVIQSRRGVGAFVSALRDRNAFRIGPECFDKRRQLAQLLQLRAGTLSDASALAASVRSESQLAEIAFSLQAMHDAVGQVSGDATSDAQTERRVTAESAFYDTITIASGNDYYVEFAGMIEAKVNDNLRSVAMKNARAAEWGLSVLAEHDAVFEALHDQDPEAARAATRHHFEEAAKRLIARKDFADV